MGELPVQPAASGEDMAQEIRRLAAKGAFVEADALREKLISMFPLEVALIVSTGQFIEEEKTTRLDRDHLALWQGLYDALSEEETNAIYYRLKDDRIGAGKVLFLQSKPNNRLFFVEGGEVVLFYRKSDKNVPLAKVGRGAVIGEETFFGISYSTFSAATHTEVRLRHLSRADTADWPANLPGLLDKLNDYCRKVGSAESVIHQKNLERRTHPRFKLMAVATAVILDHHGRHTGNYFKGDVVDVSQSGVCFSMKCSKQETARALLGRSIALSITAPDTEQELIRSSATIVKVSFLLHNDYHVHARLTERIDDAQFKKLPYDRSSSSVGHRR